MATENLQTPKGTAVFPSLHAPDTKFDDLGSYKADVRLDPQLPEVKKFLNDITTLYKQHMGSAHPKRADASNKNAVFYIETDKESGEETGMVIVKLRVKNKLRKKDNELWDRRPAQFDARGKPIASPKKVGGGTVMKVSFEPYCWAHSGKKGVSLQPLAVQIIKLVEWTSQRDASAFGFGEEDGYVEDEDENTGGFSDETADNDDEYGTDTVDAGEDDADY